MRPLTAIARGMPSGRAPVMRPAIRHTQTGAFGSTSAKAAAPSTVAPAVVDGTTAKSVTGRPTIAPYGPHAKTD